MAPESSPEILRFNSIFHFDQGHNGRICHILCVNHYSLFLAVKSSDQEKDEINGDLSDMTIKYNKLRRKCIESKKEINKKRAQIIILNSKYQLEKEKTSLLPLGKFWQSIFHYISQIIMKMLVLLLVLA